MIIHIGKYEFHLSLTWKGFSFFFHKQADPNEWPEWRVIQLLTPEERVELARRQVVHMRTGKQPNPRLLLQKPGEPIAPPLVVEQRLVIQASSELDKEIKERVKKISEALKQLPPK